MIEFNEENHTFNVQNSQPIAYQDMSLSGKERVLSYFKEITKEHIVFSTLVEGQKKQFSVQTKDLTSLGITKKALETIRNTKGSEHRFQALQNELLPKPPSHSPDPRLYSGTKNKERQERSQQWYREKNR